MTALTRHQFRHGPIHRAKEGRDELLALRSQKNHLASAST